MRGMLLPNSSKNLLMYLNNSTVKLITKCFDQIQKDRQIVLRVLRVDRRRDRRVLRVDRRELRVNKQVLLVVKRVLRVARRVE